MSRLLVDLGPLRQSREFRLLFFGQLVSMLGSQMTLVAVPYQTYHLTHSSFMVGVVSLIQLPFLITGSLWGGAVGDRRDRRQVLAAGSVLLALLSVALGWNARGAGSLWIMVALSSIYAGTGGFTAPARSAAIPRLVKEDQLVAAYSLNMLTFQIGAVAGPALAGVLLAAFGLPSLYWIDAVSFLAVTVTSLRLRPLVPEGAAPGTSLRRSILEGFTYLRTHTLAQCVYLVDLNAMIFGMPRALFPAMAIANYHGGTRMLGLLVAAPGVGAFVGALTTGWVEGVTRRGRAVVVAVAIWGVGIALFGVSPWPVVGLLALALAGWADVISAVLRNTILQTTTADSFRGRLSAIQMAVVTGGPRLGDLEAGGVASLAGTPFSVVSGGVACVAGAFALAAWKPEFWREDARTTSH